jgi:hypothetical protein
VAITPETPPETAEAIAAVRTLIDDPFLTADLAQVLDAIAERVGDIATDGPKTAIRRAALRLLMALEGEAR